MRWTTVAEVFKPEAPFTDVRRKLREGLKTGKIMDTDPAGEAIAKVFDSLDLTVFVLALEEFGVDPNLHNRDVQTLHLHLERLDRKYEMAHKITAEKSSEHLGAED